MIQPSNRVWELDNENIRHDLFLWIVWRLPYDKFTRRILQPSIFVFQDFWGSFPFEIQSTKINLDLDLATFLKQPPLKSSRKYCLLLLVKWACFVGMVVTLTSCQNIILAPWQFSVIKLILLRHRLFTRYLTTNLQIIWHLWNVSYFEDYHLKFLGSRQTDVVQICLKRELQS